MRQLTREEAIYIADSKSWQQLTTIERAAFQLNQKRLFLPFDEFQRSMEEALGRPVFTHEFGLNYDGLVYEMKHKVIVNLDKVFAKMVPTQAEDFT